MIMPQASLAFDTTSKNPLYTWVGFSEGWPGEEGMVNVSESIRAMVEWIMPICTVSTIQIDSVQHASSTAVCWGHEADLLESIMDGLNIPLLARLVWLPRHIYLSLEFSRITCFFNPLTVVVWRTDSQASNALHKLSQLTLKSRSCVYTTCLHAQAVR